MGCAYGGCVVSAGQPIQPIQIVDMPDADTTPTTTQLAVTPEFVQTLDKLKADTEAVYRGFTPTSQQLDFLSALVNTSDNLTLLARAGTGKTSTILLGVDAYVSRYPSHDVWVCAYNKSIADEVSGKLKSRGYTWPKVQASTVHSAGWGLVKYAFRLSNDDIEDNKVRNIIYERVDNRRPDWQLYEQYTGQIMALVKYGKQGGVGFFDDMQIGDTRVWYELADHFDVNGIDDTSLMDDIVRCAQSIYRASLDQTSVVDFDDMILFPLVKNLRVKFTKDLIFVDEAQDLSRARQALIRKFIRPGSGRIVIVGDDKQAIYGFSGADSQALNNLTESMGARTLPLSVTWRCPRSVVKLAQTIVPDITAAESAIEGEVLHVSELPTDLTLGKDRDVVLCRNTAPLIGIAYKLIRQGTPCKVEGRKIGEGLIQLVRRWKVTTTAQLTDRLEVYRDREMQKAQAKGNEQKAMEVDDRVNTLLQIIAAVNGQGKTRTDDVVDFISNLFADGADHVVTLATYHRSKGREWDRVVLWEHTSRCPSKGARQPWQKEQERHLCYVSWTRAKKTLVFVN